MTEHNQYIVQFVGFKTNLSDNDFIQRWRPFALNFKQAGIMTIDLYKVRDNDHLTFISRNIWNAKTYFQNFPNGIAGSGSGGGVLITQYGGYWISKQELTKPHTMQLLFTNDSLPSAPITRKRCTENIRYENQIELDEMDHTLVSKNQSDVLSCTHMKTM